MTGATAIALGMIACIALMRSQSLPAGRRAMFTAILSMLAFLFAIVVVSVGGDLPREHNWIMVVAPLAGFALGFLQFLKIPALVSNMTLPSWLTRPVTLFDFVFGGILLFALVVKYAVAT